MWDLQMINQYLNLNDAGCWRDKVAISPWKGTVFNCPCGAVRHLHLSMSFCKTFKNPGACLALTHQTLLKLENWEREGGFWVLIIYATCLIEALSMDQTGPNQYHPRNYSVRERSLVWQLVHDIRWARVLTWWALGCWLSSFFQRILGFSTSTW